MKSKVIISVTNNRIHVMSSRTFPNISLLKESGTRKQIQWWTQKGEMSLLARWQGSPISMTMKSWYQLITRLSDIKTPRKQTQWCHRCRWRVQNTSTRHWTPEPRKLSAFQSRCKRISRITKGLTTRTPTWKQPPQIRAIPTWIWRPSRRRTIGQLRQPRRYQALDWKERQGPIWLLMIQHISWQARLIQSWRKIQAMVLSSTQML